MTAVTLWAPWHDLDIVYLGHASAARPPALDPRVQIGDVQIDDSGTPQAMHRNRCTIAAFIDGLVAHKRLPVIKFREHCITCFSCEIFCPEQIVDVHPSVKNRPRPW